MAAVSPEPFATVASLEASAQRPTAVPVTALGPAARALLHFGKQSLSARLGAAARSEQRLTIGAPGRILSLAKQKMATASLLPDDMPASDQSVNHGI